MPSSGQGTGLGLAVANHRGNDKVRVVERRSKSVGERIAELATLVDGARGFRRHVARDSARERELFEEVLHSLLVL